MGRITIFTLDECQYCKRTKAALNKLEIPFTEISLTAHPDKLKDMLSITNNKLQVPQVFFNDDHIGGADDTIAVLDKWDKEQSPPLERYRQEVESQPDPTDPRLSLSTASPARGEIPPTLISEASKESAKNVPKDPESHPDPMAAMKMADESIRKEIKSDLAHDLEEAQYDTKAGGKVRSGPEDPHPVMPVTHPVESPTPPGNEDGVQLPGPTGGKVSVTEITRQLMESMPRANLPYRGKIFKNSFKGSDGVSAIMETYGLSDRKEAVSFGRELQRRNILHHVKDEHDFDDTGKWFFRLQPYHNPRLLNSFRVWTDKADTDPVGLSIRLKHLIDKVESKSTDQDGKVDYLAALKDPDFLLFEEAVCELQGVEGLASMDDPTKIAIGLNLFNLMIQHAYIKVGIPSNSLHRGSFFSDVRYNIGGDHLSLNELEHGMLRANAKPPSQISAPFGKSDPRLQLAVTKVDPRIHCAFEINWEAEGAPPVKAFTAASVEEELSRTALAYWSENKHLRLDEKNYWIALPAIYDWYRSDFELVPEHRFSKYLRGERRKMLRRMIDNGVRYIDIFYRPYHWNTNASMSLKYDSSALSEEKVSVAALLAV